MAGKSRNVAVPDLVEGWQDRALCRNHPTLPISAWTGDRPERATREAKARFDLEREGALGFCWICPVQWECAIYAHLTFDRFNVCATNPLDMVLFRKVMKGRDIVLAFEAMKVEGIPVQDGVLAIVRAGVPSHVVVRSADGTILHKGPDDDRDDRTVEGLSAHQ